MPKREKKPREYRGVIDEIREQQMKTRDMSIKGKLGYFWDYYKVHTLVAILVLVFGSILIHDVATAKDYCFNSIVMNAHMLSGEALAASFAEYAELDTDTYQCFIDTNSSLSLHAYDQYSMATVQKMMAQMQTGELDTMIFDSELFNNYAPSEIFADLRTVLTEKELERYREHLYYVDNAEILARKEALDNMENLETTASLPPYDEESILAEAQLHRHPEDMEEPIPVGVFLAQSPFALKSGACPGPEPVFGIVATSHRPDTGKKYLEFLWNEEIDFSQVLNPELF